MKTTLLQPFERIPYFTIEGFKQAADISKAEQARLLLHRWVKAGHLIQLKNGVYMTRRFYEQRRNDAAFSAAVSAIILPQSYLSLEYILQKHNLLTEVTYPVTAITAKNTRRIVNSIGTFWYRHLRADLYHGFTISDYFGVQFAEATLAKALFDFLYLRPLSNVLRASNFDLADELRLNLDDVAGAAISEFFSHVEQSGVRKMELVADNLRRNVWRP
jgi:predicted transcriptional regulator of viral defense system